MFKVVNVDTKKELRFNTPILLKYWAMGKYLPDYDLYYMSNISTQWVYVSWEQNL